MEVILVNIAIAILCYVMAEHRGREKWLGFASGLLFGLFTVIYYWIVGDTRELRIQKAKELVKLIKE